MTASLTEKFDFALKALTLTRAQLSAELGLHKSVVARWLNGSVTPSPHNLQRFTAMIAKRVPGFTILDWEKDLTGLARALRVDEAPPPAPSTVPDGLPLALLGQVVATTAMRGAAYEGFYRSTRPISQHPGRFVHDYLMVRRDAGGLLRFEMIADGVIARGWTLLLHSQVFTICEELTSGAFAFAMFNGVNGPRAGVLDGLILNLSGGAERSPTATAVIMERIGDLSGDDATDDAVFDSMRQRDVYATSDSLSEDLKAHLVRDIGPLALGAGGDWLLRSPPSRSRSGGPDRPPEA